MDRRILGKLFLFLFLRACVLALFFLPSAGAAGAEIAASVGGAGAIPSGHGESRIGAILRVGVSSELATAHELGVHVDAGIFGRPNTEAHESVKLLGFYRYTLSDGSGMQPFLGASLGFGIWRGCVRGDYCGGLGPSLAVEVGSRLRLSDAISLSGSIELGSQMGMVNLVGVMLMPSIFVALGF